MRSGRGKCCIVRRDEMIHTPSRSLRFLTNVDEPLRPPEISPRRCSFLIRKIPKGDSGLCIWNVEPCNAWDPEQRVFHLHANDPRHIVIRLRRRKSEGVRNRYMRDKFHKTNSPFLVAHSLSRKQQPASQLRIHLS